MKKCQVADMEANMLEFSLPAQASICSPSANIYLGIVFPVMQELLLTCGSNLLSMVRLEWFRLLKVEPICALISRDNEQPYTVLVLC